MKRFVIGWAIAGVLVPALILLLHQLQLRLNPYLIMLIWPSGILLMANQSAGHFLAIINITISIAINVAVYSAVGAVIWLIGRVLR